MIRSRFFICPVCGNIIHTLGEAVIHCHGVQLLPEEAEETDEEYYVRIEHGMNKKHYISFIATVSSDRIQMVKLYPEGNAEARFNIDEVKRLYFYCNQSGLYYRDLLNSNKTKIE